MRPFELEAEQIVPLSSLKFKHFSIIPALTEDERAQLVNAIQEDGYIDPILINASGEIMDGNNRAQVAQELGYQNIPAKSLKAHPELDEDEEMKEKFQIRRCLAGRNIRDIATKDKLLVRLSELVTKRKIQELETITSGSNDRQTDEATRKRTLQALKNHGDVKETAKIAGVSKSTVARAKKAARGEPKQKDYHKKSTSVRPTPEPKIPSIDDVCSEIESHLLKIASILTSKKLKENFQYVSPEMVGRLGNALALFWQGMKQYQNILDPKRKLLEG